VYQPYRPPPSPLPAKYRNLPITEVFEILRNRLGLWYEYAPLIGSLLRDGFTPSSIEEVTGISGVEQNCIVVATQVKINGYNFVEFWSFISTGTVLCALSSVYHPFGNNFAF
jgi:Rubisco accumulation factor 1 helix turn helix domain